MNVFRRAWRVYADPSESEAASWLRVLIPLEMVSLTFRVVVPDWRSLSGTTLVSIVFMYAALWFVRQRDEARAELRARITSG